MAEPFLSETDALAGWLNSEAPANEVMFSATRRLAARIVQRFAPVPDENPVPADYESAAADAELFVGGYLIENPGRYSSLSIEVGSISYAEQSALLSLVSQAMPEEYLAMNKGYIESVSW
jgi:hypothetical protein